VCRSCSNLAKEINAQITVPALVVVLRQHEHTMKLVSRWQIFSEYADRALRHSHAQLVGEIAGFKSKARADKRASPVPFVADPGSRTRTMGLVP